MNIFTRVNFISEKGLSFPATGYYIQTFFMKKQLHQLGAFEDCLLAEIIYWEHRFVMLKEKKKYCFSDGSSCDKYFPTESP